MTSLRQSAARSLFWTLLESGGLSGVSFLALIVFARLLTPTEMGVGTIAIGMVQLLAVPVEVLFQDALIQRAEVDEAHFDTAFTASIGLGLAVTLLGWACSGLLADVIGAPEIAPVFAVMNLSQIPLSIATVVAARQRRDLEFRSLALRSLAGRLGGAAVGILIAVLGGGVWALVAQQVLLVAFAALVLWVMAAHRPRLRFSLKHFNDMIGFGLQSVSVMLANVAMPRVYMLLLGTWLGTASAGYVTIAFRTIDMLRDLLAGAVAQLALPLFGRFQKNAGELRRAYVEATSFTCLIGFPVFAGLALCAPEIVDILYGPKWQLSTPYIALLGLLVLPYFIRLYVMPCMAASGRPQAALPSLLATLAFIAIGMATLGRTSLVMAGAVWAARLLISMPIDAFMLRRVSGIGYRAQLGGAVSAFLASLVMAAAVLIERETLLQHVSPHVRVAAMASLGTVVYCGAMLLLDRATVVRLLDFAKSAIRRQKAEPDRGAVGLP